MRTGQACNRIQDIPDSEILSRRVRAFSALEADAPDALVLFSSNGIFYLLGGYMSPTERPMCLIVKSDATAYMMVPRLEEEYCAQVSKCIRRIYVYDEYPGPRHPLFLLKEILNDLGLGRGRIAVDSDGYPPIYGSRGPKISEVCQEASICLRPRLIEGLQRIKSPFDRSVLRETARWGNYAHTLLRDYSRAGLREFEIVDRVKQEATQAMLSALGPGFNATGPVESHARAVFRGQVGKLSYWPHITPNNAMLQRGDNLVTGANGFILGYRTEMERTMFVGEPSEVQQIYYQHALTIQQIGIDAIQRGKRCGDVDREVYRYYEENDLLDCWRHHTGHSIGFNPHEPPFLDAYEDMVIEPGMVFTCEPGLYVKDVGGFRISDTILVTETGKEVLTFFSKSLDEIICDK